MTEALLLSGGVARAVDLATARNSTDHDLMWLHIDAGSSAQATLAMLDWLPPAVVAALTAVETRPRCDSIDDGILLNLRVPAAGPVDHNDVLVSVRAWIMPKTLISVSLRPSPVVARARAAMLAGNIHDVGDAMIALISDAAGELDEEIAGLGDRLDALEEAVAPDAPPGMRRKVTRLRAEAIRYRRFIQPQRQAVERLSQYDHGCFDDDERLALRNAADRFARMAEELEAVRERAAVVTDELTDMRSERLDARSLQVAIVALIFLPITFITGLLGMNVAGIPFAQEPWAFWGVLAFCVVIALAVAGWFIIQRWTSR